MQMLTAVSPEIRAQIEGLRAAGPQGDDGLAAFHVVLFDINNPHLQNQAAQALGRGLLREHLGPDATLVSVRILITKPRAPAQAWHLDYTSPLSGNLFITLTEATLDNTTETIEFMGPCAMEALLGAPDEVAICDYPHRVKKHVSPEGMLLHLRPGTLHRRGENRSDFTRETLAIDYTLSAAFDFREQDPSLVIEALSDPALHFRYDQRTS